MTIKCALHFFWVRRFSSINICTAVVQLGEPMHGARRDTSFICFFSAYSKWHWQLMRAKVEDLHLQPFPRDELNINISYGSFILAKWLMILPQAADRPASKTDKLGVKNMKVFNGDVKQYNGEESKQWYMRCQRLSCRSNWRKKREMINLTDDIKIQLGNWSCFLWKQKNIVGG